MADPQGQELQCSWWKRLRRSIWRLHRRLLGSLWSVRRNYGREKDLIDGRMSSWSRGSGIINIGEVSE